MKNTNTEAPSLQKSPTGIHGLDEITFGGLPKGRPTLICGGPGCGKTLFAMEFLTRGALEFNEPGVFMSFEENVKDLISNFSSLHFKLDKLVKEEKIVIDYVYIERSEIEETGEYDLEGLFIRLGSAIDSIGAKRVVLDTVEALFAGFSNESILRAELRRLFQWLKNKGVTAIITGERGDHNLTKHGLEEYVADCVIQLDHRVMEQAATRRLKIIKYRGSKHGTNEYPFLIDHDGISVLPITSLGLDYDVSTERISSGIDGVDKMMDGKGFYRGSAILLSGGAGTGKTTVAMKLIDAACKRGEKCLLLAFEESPQQIVRDMKSVGMDIQKWLDKNILYIASSRPSVYGLEMHLVKMHNLIKEFNPSIVVIDPISNMISTGTMHDVKSMLVRLLDSLRISGTTVMMTDLYISGTRTVQTEIEVSSLADTWINLRNEEIENVHTRKIVFLKSRGMGHSSKIHEFEISAGGVEIKE
jgi:circadian clock protein KaiC